ncbi:MAG TPA: hypothetical protein DDZ80_03950 [Cyanobacteria bacterium UBA8803]|nr:hypothetical protein [Cyanobacteria bacterium UBA9273]HBL57715.1 hypothetical protein [Cyanobacteria bacterium UBA8803]
MNKQELPSQDVLKKVRQLITQCEEAEPPFDSLGTPYVGISEETQNVIDMGSTAVPALCELLPTATAHAAACIAFCLGRLGDSRAIPVLEQMLARYENKKDKSPFDYAFIGNAREALQLIRG